MNTFRNPLRSPLFWRLLIFFCIANLLVLVLGGALTRSFIAYSSEQDIDWPALAQAANDAYESGGNDALDAWVREERNQGIDATLYEKGQPLRAIRLPPPMRESLPAWLAAGRDIELNPWPGYYVAVQQVTASDGHTRQFVAASSSRSRFPPHTREKMLLGVQAVLSLLLIGAVGWWVARSVSRPVDAMRKATQRMAAGEFHTRVEQRWSNAHDELGQLSRDFNGMAERLEVLVTHDRRVLQDLSHELRSPLARLHVLLDLVQHSTNPETAVAHYAQAETEIARMDRMTSEMLALSRLEGGLPGMEREPVDLTHLVDERVQAAQVDAAARAVQLIVHHDPAAVIVHGSGILIERAFDNLIANAIKFSPAQAKVDVSVTRDGHNAIVNVRDHGPGVPEDELPLLFRPFYRGSNAVHADGHGLGLAIVQRVVQVHGGDVSAQNVTNAGLSLTMRLPASQDQSKGSGKDIG